ncbi:MAG: YybS family protein [Peptococcaceae bacterium]|nr:YybS family protein [Peptococcaceae bacterium]
MNFGKSKILAESALMAALTGVFALISLYVPVAGLFVAMVWIMPVVVVCVRHGVKMALCALLIASVIILALTSPLIAVTMILPCAVPALLLGMAFQKKLSTAQTLFMVTAGTLVSRLLSFMLLLFVSGMSLGEQLIFMQEQMKAFWMSLYDMSSSSGWIEARMTEEAFLAQADQFTTLFYQMLPSLFLVYSLLSTIFTYILTYQILTRIRIELPVPLPFRLWRWSWWFVWGFIIGLACLLAGSHMEVPVLTRIGLNFISAFQWIYIINALSMIAFFLGKINKRWRRSGVFFVVVGFLLFASPMIYLMIAIGLSDMLFNLRRLPDRSVS